MAVNYSAMQLVTCPYLPVKGDLAILCHFYLLELTKVATVREKTALERMHRSWVPCP